MTKYDLIIIGGGPGGYVAASHAAKNGLKVALVEASFLGGTCLNTGCIPSKTYLEAAAIASAIQQAHQWGFDVQQRKASLQVIKQRKDTVVSQLRHGISFLMKQGKINVYNGLGKLDETNTNQVIVSSGQDEKKIEGTSILIATGSKPIVPNIPGIDLAGIYTTDTIFEVENLPKNIIIVGGGVIGVEFATIFTKLGSEVTLIEAAPTILAMEDPEAANVLATKLISDGTTIIANAQVNQFEENEQHIKLSYTIDNQLHNLETEAVLVCIGRKPNISSIEQVLIEMNGPFINVDQRYKTSIQNVYAIGDVIGGYQLAHVASAEGIAAVDDLLGKRILMDVRHVPRCIYTTPEIASVGLTEQQVKEKGVKYKIEKFNHKASGKALVMGETEGFTKILYDDRYGEILGVTIVGLHATEMISESTAFMRLEGTLTELANMIHPHPTISEGIFEAALAAVTTKQT
ncbi:MAG: dihydrolipoyl dehydrogenase [Solibacillus sp.]